VEAGAGSRMPLRMFERNNFPRWLQRAEQRSLTIGFRSLDRRMLRRFSPDNVLLRHSVFVTMQRQRRRSDVVGRRRNHHTGQPSPAPEATVIILAIAETTKLAAHLSTFMFAAVRLCLARRSRAGSPLQKRIASAFSGRPLGALLRH
jgi:hypothetical protein